MADTKEIVQAERDFEEAKTKMEEAIAGAAIARDKLDRLTAASKTVDVDTKLIELAYLYNDARQRLMDTGNKIHALASIRQEQILEKERLEECLMGCFEQLWKSQTKTFLVGELETLEIRYIAPADGNNSNAGVTVTVKTVKKV